MSIFAFLLLGLIAGVIAKAIMPGRDGGSIIMTMILGVVGALAGGFIAAAAFNAHPMKEFFNLSTWACAILGSIVVLAIYRAVAGTEEERQHTNRA